MWSTVYGPQAGVTSDGGKTYALNVIPIEAKAGFDIRISPDRAAPPFATNH